MEKSPADYVKEDTWLADPVNGGIMQIVRKSPLAVSGFKKHTMPVLHLMSFLDWVSHTINITLLSSVMDRTSVKSVRLYRIWQNWDICVFVEGGRGHNLRTTKNVCCQSKHFLFPATSTPSKCGSSKGITSHLPDIFNSCCFYHITFSVFEHSLMPQSWYLWYTYNKIKTNR